MLPPESTTYAAQRWLELLRRSSVNQAWALLQASSAYADLPASTYLQALDWLRALGFTEPAAADARMPRELSGLPPAQLHQLLYARGLALDAPPWLPDADSLVTTADQLPDDAAALAEQLGLTASQSLAGIGQARGKVDPERTAEIGLRGEEALCAALEAAWPGSVSHLAAYDDGWGYDVSFTPASGQQWHLEVKTTTRKGRFEAFLSRNEHAVAAADPTWRAVAVGLGPDGSIAAVATVKAGLFAQRAPEDTHVASRWASTRYQLRPDDLERGLPFLPRPRPIAAESLAAGLDPDGQYAWMPGWLG